MFTRISCIVPLCTRIIVTIRTRSAFVINHHHRIIILIQYRTGFKRVCINSCTDILILISNLTCSADTSMFKVKSAGCSVTYLLLYIQLIHVWHKRKFDKISQGERGLLSNCLKIISKPLVSIVIYENVIVDNMTLCIGDSAKY